MSLPVFSRMRNGRAPSPAPTRWIARAAALLLAVSAPLHAQGGPPPEVRAAVQALEGALTAANPAALDSFIVRRTSPALQASLTVPVLRARLQQVRATLGARIDDVSLERTDTGLLLMLSGQGTVHLPLEIDAAGMITRLDEPRARVAPVETDSLWSNLTWEALADRLRAAETTGFSGVVLARRGADTVVHATYGFADSATNVRSSLQTVYGIGSTPIDFTVTGIMLLGQRGKLALDDSVSRWLDGVPADKRGLTIRHLLTGRSGLPDFFDMPAKDWNPDLAWIDRETAEQRILALPVLFAPGSAERHSHAAFGLLAALIERVDGRTYQDFVRAEILEPLGMTRTGFYGEQLGLRVQDFAVGPGPNHVGLPNIPPNWGPTSWLVMGSGGMSSTLGNMMRYYDAIDSGRLLTGTWAKWQQGASQDAGGSDQGFFIYRASNGRGNSILFLMNGEGRSPRIRAMTKAFQQLVEPRAR